MFGAVLSIFILIYNQIFYLITEPLVRMIGLHFKVEEEARICFYIFVCLFLDMVFL